MPLYIIGMPMNYQVTLANTAAQGNKPLKVRVQAVSSTLQTNCTAGQQLGVQDYVVENLRPGESRTLQYSVNLNDPNLPGGLDVTKVRIFHDNQGNPNAGLIMETDVYWCPPSVRTAHP